ncbi:arylsulfatase A-like enzyme [Phyllobacterium myrsinacearum]|uniref:sulfatase family protein n=1 Tax=Phyllobacterium myrsinacearum TaxID=28101 RepID=UPI00102A8206|nr:sulfatase-like hydrolase/transferase [Phyllobacterium myrsinacearum]RZS83390.1 arylsulfatase A-like enzyme [Phyllobacterium myrsinacearum]
MYRKVVTRRTLLQGAAISTVLATAGSQSSRANSARKPNILFILADDLGYADLSSYGHPTIKTPHIDSLGQNGTRFLQAYSNSAVCSATRTALITGRYQYRLPLGLEEPLAGADVGLPPEHPTLPSLLKKAGYQTTLIGKWHMGSLPKFGPLQSGYEHFYGFRGGAVDYYSHDSNKKNDFWDDDVAIEKVGYLTDLLGDRAVETISSNVKANKPFLISLHFSAPHWPWEVPGEEGKKESERIARQSLSLATFDAGSQEIYRRIVERLDYQIGRVLEALKDNGVADDTIVIFTSDNGGERFSNTWPFSGKKSELLEGGLRIPALIRWTGKIAAGRATNQVAISMDWLPTLLEAAGTTPDPAFPPDGISLLPVLTGATPVKERKLFWRYKGNKQRAARIGDDKYLKILDNTFLFNVVHDPLERTNLKTRNSDTYKKILSEWRAWNASMLSETDASYTFGFSGDQFADHIGARAPTRDRDVDQD